MIENNISYQGTKEKSIILCFRRVFLGFLSGGSWLVALKTPERRENSSEDEDDLMFGISRPSPVDELSPTTGVLELWLYHPHKPIKLVRVLCTRINVHVT